MWKIEAAQTTGSTKFQRLADLRRAVACCEKCPNLASTRTQTVFGEGDPDASLMLVGEAPGKDEDLQGSPFIGEAGKFLNKLISALGLKRLDVYVANVLKCRPDTVTPGGNRPPTGVEVRDCLPYLYAQIEIVQPKAIVALGNTAMEGLLWGQEYERGFVYDFSGIPVVTTYHPSFVLRNPTQEMRQTIWLNLLAAWQLTGAEITDEQLDFIPKLRDVA